MQLEERPTPEARRRRSARPRRSRGSELHGRLPAHGGLSNRAPRRNRGGGRGYRRGGRREGDGGQAGTIASRGRGRRGPTRRTSWRGLSPVHVPAGVSTQVAAASMLQGMTADYLSHDRRSRSNESDTCLVHAAAGGVGLLLAQMARRAGARVIGTTSTEEKAKLARDAGVDEVIFVHARAHSKRRCGPKTGGRGVDVVYDSGRRRRLSKGASSHSARAARSLSTDSRAGACRPSICRSSPREARYL